MLFSWKKSLLTSAACILASLSVSSLVHADSVAVQIDSKQSMTNPGDVWEGSITFDSFRTGYDNGTWEMELTNPFADGAEGYRYIVGRGWWDTRGKADGQYVQPIGFQTLTDDYRGYLLTVRVYNQQGQLIDTNSTGIDVSSDWTMFPRYGALTRFKPEDKGNSDAETLNKFHINATMFYDAYYRPQNPFPYDTFDDWVGKKVSLDTIRTTIAQNNQFNQASMLYNMINATTGSPMDKDSSMDDGKFVPIRRKDDTVGVQSPWGLYVTSPRGIHEAGATWKPGQANTGDAIGEQLTHNMTGGWEVGRTNANHTIQSYYDPSNPEWANYIGNKMWGALTYMGFDGWQGDSIGNFDVVRYNDRFSLNNQFGFNWTFGQFVNQLKDNQMKDFKLGVNAVGGKGQGNLDKSKADFLYEEVWSNDWDFDDNVAEGNRRGDTMMRHKTYADLARIVDNSKQRSGKSLIMPAYMYRDWNHAGAHGMGATFKDEAILLKDAFVFAAGGDPMELADDGSQIYDEYYTQVSRDKHIQMSQQLGDANNGKLRKMYDFITAYENVLRGGDIQNNYHNISITRNGVELADKDGSAGSIWTVTKSGHTGYHDIETINMINLTGVSNANWQVNSVSDEDAKQITPTGKLHVKYYVDEGRPIHHVWAASPDRNDGNAQKLEFTTGRDDKGSYVEFDVPELELWNVVYMRH